jgi:hypothetical protein
MVAALLYYKKFVKSFVNHGVKLNPYDGCVTNKIVKGKQITVCFHVDDCKISHEHPKVVDETIDWLRVEYESIFEDGSGAMKVLLEKEVPTELKVLLTLSCTLTSLLKHTAEDPAPGCLSRRRIAKMIYFKL